jgi:ribosomal protein S18 acetylase RimI-like enzyme
VCVQVIVDRSRQHLADAAQIWAQATAARDGDAAVAPLELSRELIQQVLDTSPQSLLLITVDESGAVVGFATAAPRSPGDETTAELKYIGVRPDAWGRGAGSSLLLSAAELLREAGFAKVVLKVYGDNVRAVRLYEKLGWHRIGAGHPHGVSGRLLEDYSLDL